MTAPIRPEEQIAISEIQSKSETLAKDIQDLMTWRWTATSSNGRKTNSRNGLSTCPTPSSVLAQKAGREP